MPSGRNPKKRPKHQRGRSVPPSRGGAPDGALEALPPELRGMVREVMEVVRHDPGGWATIADALKEAISTDPEVEPEVMMDFFARCLGKDALPLLRGLAVDEDEALAHAALRALPLLGTRAAGETLAEAYAAHPEGERARLAWEGVQALQARGINVSVPEPRGVVTSVPRFQLRGIWESAADGVGSCSTFARAQDRYGVWHTVMMVRNERTGLKDGFAVPMSRKEWEEVLEESAEHDAEMIQVPEEYGRWQVARARELNARTGFPLDDHLEDWDRMVGPPPEDYTPPDPLGLLDGLSDDERRELAEQADTLSNDSACSHWAFEPADCRKWLGAWQKVLDIGDDVDEQEDALLARIVRGLLTPEMVARYRERLLDTARKLRWDADEEAAAIAAAVVWRIDRGDDPATMEFFLSLAHTGLTFLEEMLEQGVDPESQRYDPMAPVPEVF